MPKSTEKGLLAKAVRNGKLMLSTLVDAYDSGDIARMQAALLLVNEFHKDARNVLDPVIAAALSVRNGNAEHVEAVQ